ncbi:MAG: hypothetical protein LBR91_01000 [Puniceicoccales bacterium]|nr:hypothetical protein [Puniceicoccales bacterium]
MFAQDLSISVGSDISVLGALIKGNYYGWLSSNKTILLANRKNVYKFIRMVHVGSNFDTYGFGGAAGGASCGTVNVAPNVPLGSPATLQTGTTPLTGHSVQVTDSPQTKGKISGNNANSFSEANAHVMCFSDEMPGLSQMYCSGQNTKKKSDLCEGEKLMPIPKSSHESGPATGKTSSNVTSAPKETKSDATSTTKETKSASTTGKIISTEAPAEQKSTAGTPSRDDPSVKVGHDNAFKGFKFRAETYDVGTPGKESMFTFSSESPKSMGIIKGHGIAPMPGDPDPATGKTSSNVTSTPKETKSTSTTGKTVSTKTSAKDAKKSGVKTPKSASAVGSSSSATGVSSSKRPETPETFLPNYQEKFSLRGIPDRILETVDKNIDFSDIKSVSEKGKKGREVFGGLCDMCHAKFDPEGKLADSKLFESGELKTNEDCSVYKRYNIKGGSGNGRSRSETNDIKGGDNQCDMSIILKGSLVSCSPIEKIEKPSAYGTPKKKKKSMEIRKQGENAFRECIEKAGIKVIVDCRHKSCKQRQDLRLINDYTDPNVGPDHISFFGGASEKTEIGGGLGYCKQVKIKNSEGKKGSEKEICYIRLDNLPDMEALSNKEVMQFMRFLDGLEDKGVDTSSILFHCNGGLGRSPYMLAMHGVYRATQDAAKAGLELTFDESRQKEALVDGKFNVANAMRNIVILGNCARSTFIQAEVQLKGLVDFAKSLPGVMSPACFRNAKAGTSDPTLSSNTQVSGSSTNSSSQTVQTPTTTAAPSSPPPPPPQTPPLPPLPPPQTPTSTQPLKTERFVPNFNKKASSSPSSTQTQTPVATQRNQPNHGPSVKGGERTDNKTFNPYRDLEKYKGGKWENGRWMKDGKPVF